MEIKYIKNIMPKSSRKFVFEAKPLDVNLQKMQTKLRQRCELEMSGDGDFAQIEEKYTVHRNYQHELPANEIKLVCKKSDDCEDKKQRVVELAVTNITKTVETRCVIAEGTKEKILNILEDVGLFLDIKSDVLAICNGVAESIDEANRSTADILFDGPEYFHMNGLICLQGNDTERAFSWFEKAAGQGHVIAMRCIANMYLQGFRPVQISVEEAFKRIDPDDFDEKGLIMSGPNFGLFELNRDVPDFESAWKWYMKAAELGDLVSKLNAGVMAFQGEGCPKDIALAKQLLGEAARRGQPLAQKTYHDYFGDFV